MQEEMSAAKFNAVIFVDPFCTLFFFRVHKSNLKTHLFVLFLPHHSLITRVPISSVCFEI
jgi:hypothetical protein